MQVPFFDVKASMQPHIAQIEEAIKRVVDSGWFVLGQELAAFESAFAQYCGAKHAIGVANGLDALSVILMAYKELGLLQPNDEVLLPSHTFIATALAVSYQQLKPVFVDINPDTYTIDMQDAVKKITSRTRVIIPVHLYGQCADMKSVADVAKQHDLLIIEDAAQAHGATCYGQKSGILGDAAAFSFYPAKNLGALGDGGAIVTNNDKLADVVKQIRNYGSKIKYQHNYKGLNTRLDELQAAVLRVKLTYLDTQNNQRRNIAQLYNDGIKNEHITLPIQASYAQHIWHLYVIQTNHRERFMQYLQINGIASQIHYPVPVHLQPAYQEFSNISLPVTHSLMNKIVSLPMSPVLTEEQVAYVCNIINEFEV